MSLSKHFTDEQLTRILDQSLVYQCACPAQVCRALMGLRELYDYQLNCLDRNDTDRQVHQTIAAHTADSHQALEKCLERILELEAWDLHTLTMPQALRQLQEKLL